MTKHIGSCLCNAVTFEIEDRLKGFFLCHCSRCRKVTGSAHASNLFSSEGEVNWISGRDSVKTYALPDSRFKTSFCMVCGSKVPTIEDSRRILIPAGCLNTQIKLSPNAHIFYGSRANWDKELEKIEKFEKLPL